MVAVVVGNGLGLERSSGFILGSRGQLGAAGLGRGNDGVTINAATGNLVITNRDEFVIGRGVDVGINRTYNSLGLMNDDNGDNWRLSLQRRIINSPPLAQINVVGTQFTLVDWDGSEKRFTYIAGKGYTATDGNGAYLHADISDASGRYWIITNSANTQQEWFDNQNGGRLSKASDMDRSAWTTFDYDGSGRLGTISMGDGTTTVFVWDTVNPNNLKELRTTTADIQTGAAKTLTRTRYEYDSSNRLTKVIVDLSHNDNSVSDGRTYWTSYDYVGSSRLVQYIRQSDGSQLQIGYDALNRVSAFTETVDTGITRTTQFSYSAGYSSITDPQGNITHMHYDGQGQLRTLQEPAALAGGNARFSDYLYDENGNVTSAIVYDGSANRSAGVTFARDFYEYDGNGNATSLYRQLESGYLVTRWTYNLQNQLLTETTFSGTDPDGYGGAEPTGAMITRFSYNATNHLRFKISAEGRVTEFRYNSLGQMVAEIAYLGNLYQSGTLSLAEAESWAASADKANTLRSDTGYDFRGNVSIVTNYSKSDSAGNGLLAAGYSRVLYVYDQFGSLLSKQTANGEPVVSHTSLNEWSSGGLNIAVAGTALNGQPASQYTVQSTGAWSGYYNGYTVSDGDSVTTSVTLKGIGTSPSASIGMYGYQTSWGANQYSVARIVSGPGAIVRETGGLWNITGLSNTEETRIEITRIYGQGDTGGGVYVYVDRPSGWRAGQGVIASSPVVTKSRDATETYAYDGMGRIIRYTDAKGVGTWTTYMDRESRTVVTLANGLTRTSAFNRVGELVGSTEARGGVAGANLIPNLGDLVSFAITSATADSLDGATALQYTLGTPQAGDSQHIRSNAFSAKAGDLVTASMSFRATASSNNTLIGLLGHSTGWGASNIISARIISGPGTITEYVGGVWNVSGLSTTEATRVELVRTYTQDEMGDFRVYPDYVGSHVAGNSIIASAPSVVISRYNASANNIALEGNATDINNWGYGGATRNTAGSIGGSPAAQFTVQSTGQWTGVSTGFNVTAGDTITTSVSLQGTSNGNSASFGIYGNQSDWGRDAGSVTARIISGPGTLTQEATYYQGLWNITGLVAGQTTRIEITRTFAQAESGGVYIYPERPGGWVAGRSIIIGAPSLVKMPGAVTSYKYDNLGRLRIKTDPVGTRTFYYYDIQGRLIGEVDQDGSVSEYRYDAGNRIVASVRYANAYANIAGLYDWYGNATTVTFDAIRSSIGTSAADRWAWNVYDKAGQLQRSIDAAGAITRTRYDGAGRVIKVTRFYETIPSATLESYKVNPPTNSYVITASIYDRIVQMFYDRDGLFRGTLDEENFFTENKYDKAGRQIETVRYAYAAPSLAMDASGNFTGRPAVHSTDIHNYWLYDGRGLVGATVDGEGNVTNFHYTAQGQVSKEIRGRKLNIDQFMAASESSRSLASLPGWYLGGHIEEVTDFAYDLRGQLQSRVRNLTGGSETTLWSYDSVGNMLTEATSDTVTSEARTQSFRYDSKGRMIASIGGIGSNTMLALYGTNPTETQKDFIFRTYGTRYVYDASDRLIQTIEADGSGNSGDSRRTVYYYDADGQLRYQVNALGEVAEYRYSTLEDRSDAFVFANRIANGTLASLTGGLVTAAITNAVAAIAQTATTIQQATYQGSTFDSRTQFSYGTRGELANTYNPLYPTAPTWSNYEINYYTNFGQLDVLP